MFLICAVWGWSFFNPDFILYYTLVLFYVLIPACKAPIASVLWRALYEQNVLTDLLALHISAFNFYLQLPCWCRPSLCPSGLGGRPSEFPARRGAPPIPGGKQEVLLMQVFETYKYVRLLSRCIIPQWRTHMPVLQKRQDRPAGRAGSFPCLNFSTDAVQEIQSSVTRFLILQLDLLTFHCALYAC